MKLKGKKALLIALALVFTTVFSSNCIVTFAGDAEEVGEVVGEVEEVEKKLVQASNGWTIFQYEDNTGKPLFDIKYLGETAEQLEQHNLQLQYRVMYKNDIYSQFVIYSWTNIDEEITDYDARDIYDSTRNFSIQFRILDKNSESSAAMSYVFLLYNQEEPYILASSTYSYDAYDLRTNPNELFVVLRISEPLKQTGDLSVTVSDTSKLDSLLSSFYASDLQFENLKDTYEIGDKEYSVEYSLVTFNVTLSPTIKDSTFDQLSVCYSFEFNGTIGLHTSKKPNNLIFSVMTPTTTTTLAEKIEITAPSLSVQAGNTVNLTANVLPSNATDKSVTWSSSNTDYATVDANGVVTAKTAGIGKTVTITATANDESKISGSCILSIMAIPVSNIKINSSSAKVSAGNKIALSANVAPANATNKSVTWSSSNTNYATVDANGIVTTKAAGAGKTVVITATANDGSSVSSSCTLSIVPISVKSIKLSSVNKTIQAGKKVTISANFTPSNATNKTVTWSSNNTKYATVNSKGVVTTKKAGAGKTVTITAKAKDGSGKKATIKIKIVKKVKVSSIKLTSKVKNVKAGKKVTIKATINPSNASNKAVTWSSSNKDYATVNSKGVVTTKKAGIGKTVTITAKAKDGSGKKATVKIKIR